MLIQRMSTRHITIISRLSPPTLGRLVHTGRSKQPNRDVPIEFCRAHSLASITQIKCLKPNLRMTCPPSPSHTCPKAEGGMTTFAVFLQSLAEFSLYLEWLRACSVLSLHAVEDADKPSIYDVYQSSILNSASATVLLHCTSTNSPLRAASRNSPTVK